MPDLYSGICASFRGKKTFSILKHVQNVKWESATLCTADKDLSTNYLKDVNIFAMRVKFVDKFSTINNTNDTEVGNKLKSAV